MQDSQPLGFQFERDQTDAGEIAARAIEIRNDARPDRIASRASGCVGRCLKSQLQSNVFAGCVG
jgi:hypothetical protein